MSHARWPVSVGHIVVTWDPAHYASLYNFVLFTPFPYLQKKTRHIVHGKQDLDIHSWGFLECSPTGGSPGNSHRAVIRHGRRAGRSTGRCVRHECACQLLHDPKFSQLERGRPKNGQKCQFRMLFLILSEMVFYKELRFICVFAFVHFELSQTTLGQFFRFFSF